MSNKSVMRVQKNSANPYVMLDKRIFSDINLSWKSKGILSYLLSKPDNWRVMIVDLVKQSSDGEKAVYSGLAELINTGYIARQAIRDDKGKFLYHEYRVFEQPIDITSTSPFSASGFSASGFSASGKRGATNTDTTKKDLNKNDCRVINKKTIKKPSESRTGKYDGFYL